LFTVANGDEFSSVVCDITPPPEGYELDPNGSTTFAFACAVEPLTFFPPEEGELKAEVKVNTACNQVPLGIGTCRTNYWHAISEEIELGDLEDCE
jgi:hypothetical protein